MGFNCGIVGLPNVGKSTLFNALTATEAAEAANFPFTTIEPNVGRVAVPDERLDAVARVAGPERTVPTQLEFVDIAGLVEGASRGEGLGNRFLANIREVDAVCHVLRCFEDANVAHVTGAADPVNDAAVVATELMLADLESLEKRTDGLTKRARGGDKDAAAELALAEAAQELLAAGRPARALAREPADEKPFRGLGLLTAKPVLYVLNVDETAAATGNALSQAAARMAADEGSQAVVISARIEEEIAGLDQAEERAAFIADLGLEETGLQRVIRAGYGLLDLITFFTANEREAHAWTVRRGAKAPEAAGRVHTDFEKGFIAVEAIPWDAYVELGGEGPARDAGKMRTEGRDYEVRDGNVLLFRFNA
ncbi:MAG: redox-regulated ATPase YchF [Rhodospirillales bacterium]